MTGNGRIVLVALAAAVLGGVVGLVMRGPGPLLGSEIGQRALQQVMAANAPEPPAGIVVASRGEPMPAITLPDLAGTPVELPAAHAGRPLLVNFWASWCGPCIEEMPELDRFAASQGVDGVQVVGIALDDPAAVREFLREVPVAYPILLDTPGRGDTSVQLGNPQGVLPYTVLVDAEGTITRQKIGPFQHGEVDAWAR